MGSMSTAWCSTSCYIWGSAFICLVQEGFSHMEDTILASVRAQKEDRHGSKAWANRAAFSTAAAMFRFRAIPGIAVKPEMAIVCAEGRYRVLSVEDAGGRGMYYEALAEITGPAMG